MTIENDFNLLDELEQIRRRGDENLFALEAMAERELVTASELESLRQHADLFINAVELIAARENTGGKPNAGHR